MAIAYDTVAKSAYAAAGTNATWSHTCSGSDRILFVSAYLGTSAATTATYNGVSMTEITNRAMSGGATGQYLRIWYLINPPSGTYNCVLSGASDKYGFSASYTGVLQNSQPHTFNSGGNATATSLTVSTTTTLDGCWLTGLSYSGTAQTAGSNTTIRQNTASVLYTIDSNGPQTPAGSKSLSISHSSSFNGMVMVSFAPAGLATGLVAGWKLDESSGNASDSVGSNTLTNTNVTYSAGKLNNGASFNGSTSKLSSTTSPISGSGSWSFGAWYKSSTTGTNKQIVVFGNSSQASKSTIYIYTTTGNAIQLDTAGVGLITSSNTSSLDGNWHYLVVTSTGNSFTMYIDAISVGTGSTTGMNLGSNLLGIGYDAANNRFSWNGMLDESFFWSRALSADEVSQLFNSGRANAYPFTDTPSLYGGISWHQFKNYVTDSIGIYNWTNSNVSFDGTKATFDSTSDKVTTDITGQLSSSFEIVRKFRLNTLGQIQTIFESNVASYNNYYILINTAADNKIQCSLYDGTNLSQANGTTVLTTGVDYTINFYRNVSTDKIGFYLNGTLEAEVTDTTTSTPSYSLVTLGRRNRSDLIWNLSGNEYQGGIFTRVLSTTERNTLLSNLNYPWASSPSFTPTPLIHLIGAGQIF